MTIKTIKTKKILLIIALFSFFLILSGFYLYLLMPSPWGGIKDSAYSFALGLVLPLIILTAYHSYVTREIKVDDNGEPATSLSGSWVLMTSFIMYLIYFASAVIPFSEYFLTFHPSTFSSILFSFVAIIILAAGIVLFIAIGNQTEIFDDIHKKLFGQED
ncbi:MAG: hypothetical protein ACYCTD_04900 [bacterium]